MSDDDKIAYFGQTDFRNKKTKFGIRNSDRSRHVYVIGKTGMGKSTLLENMAAQDILNGEGMCFVDPHGSAIDTLIEYIPSERVTDVVYFAPFDTQFPISFNVLEDVEPDLRHLVMAGLMASFKKIWPDSFSARMEYILANTLLALLEYPEATLLGVNRMLAEKDYRDEVIKHITDSSVKAFWIDEYNKWDPRYAKEAGAAIQNKIGQFTSNPLIRNIIGQKKTSFNLREMMDNKKILLVNLSKGQIGESNANLLGGMLITKLYLAAMSRADVGASGIKHLPPFFFFVDEFQNFANESFADILAEARKYKLNLTVAHQYVDQMQEDVASAIFGNVGTMITFRIGATDAEVFEKQFAPTFTAEDIVNLGKYQIYLSLMIDGIGSRPFSASTLPPIEPQAESMKQHIVANSRYVYAAERHIVEAEIESWFEPVKKPIKQRITDPKDINKAGEKKTFTANFPKPVAKSNAVHTKPAVKSDTTYTKPDTVKNARDFETPFKKTLKEIDEKEAELEMKENISPKLNALLDSFEKKPLANKKVEQVLKNIQKKDTFTHTSKNEVSSSVKHTIAGLSVMNKKHTNIQKPTVNNFSKKPISVPVNNHSKKPIPVSEKKDTFTVDTKISLEPILNKKRATDTETKSSLSDILARALGENTKKETPPTKVVVANNTVSLKPVDIIQKKTINVNYQKTDSNISHQDKNLVEKTSTQNTTPKPTPTPNPTLTSNNQIKKPPTNIQEIPEDVLRDILK